jgi:hypothetical protein
MQRGGKRPRRSARWVPLPVQRVEGKYSIFDVIDDGRELER